MREGKGGRGGGAFPHLLSSAVRATAAPALVLGSESGAGLGTKECVYGGGGVRCGGLAAIMDAVHVCACVRVCGCGCAGVVVVAHTLAADPNRENTELWSG
jgi:hypothetical protein